MNPEPLYIHSLANLDLDYLGREIKTRRIKYVVSQPHGHYSKSFPRITYHLNFRIFHIRNDHLIHHLYLESW